MANQHSHKGKKPARASAQQNGKGKRKHPGPSSRPGGSSKKPATFPSDRPEGIPGAGKLKASIRQTNRLLAKPNLAPGTKIEAERRLASLTADLERLQSSREEKNLSARYHKVKFFERQKLVRKIKQTKKAIAQLERKATKRNAGSGESDDGSGSETSDASGSEDGAEGRKRGIGELQGELLELRCLLHYVLRYPPDLPYVSLFANGAKAAQVPSATETDATRAKAYLVLEKIRKAVAGSKLSGQPEVDLERGEAADRANKIWATAEGDRATARAGKPQRGAQVSAARSADDDEDEDDGTQDDQDSEDGQAQGVEGDDFFASDSEDD